MRIWGLLFFLMFFSGCIGLQKNSAESPVDDLNERELPVIDSGSGAYFGFTYIRPDGNRFIEGSASLPKTSSLDVELKGRPDWVVASQLGNGSLWATVLNDGTVQAFRINDGIYDAVDFFPDRVSPKTPPLLFVQNESYFLITPTISDYSPLTHAVVLNKPVRLAILDSNGNIVIGSREMVKLEVDGIPDARLLVDESDRILLLTGPTTIYPHGVLGDKIEASSITLVDTTKEPRIERVISIPDGMVAEGISPIWADITGDGTREIIITASDAEGGARILVFNEEGTIIARGPPIGRGNRWRHQLAVAPFGPGGGLELVDVLTPHIGGVVEFYGIDGGELNIVAEVRGYSSHKIGSRNFDMGVAGDFDGDGKIELLLPNQAFTKLGAIGRTEDGAEVKWTLDAGGKVSTNIAAARLSDGSLAVGVGREDGVLRIWMK